MDQILAIALQDAGPHFGRIIKMLIDGVAFRKDRKTYMVFSHEGDDLGDLSVADVEYAISFMKKRGRPVGKTYQEESWDIGCKAGPAFTFAWIDADWTLPKTKFNPILGTWQPCAAN